ncbi:MAG TPA: GvpL/GvpF family gas vesicle protein, partial [Thermoanaerobaculia bacterium]|nr:GvpL/GvpF family gas vesicle protein [Thermoanaerobaculia bacterium]
MVDTVLYVYAITREPATPGGEAVDRTSHFGSMSTDGVAATFTPVSREEFSQEVIDRRSGDLEWLGAIGYRHQAVIANLMRMTDVIPLRAFSMFSGEAALRDYLRENREDLLAILDRVGGKQEWTLRVEFEPQRWSEALIDHADSLRGIAAEMQSASEGKAFLLRKKLEEEKKRASREAEQKIVAEIEQEITSRLRCETIAETRQQRDGAFPQINVLIDRDEEAKLVDLHS